MNIIILCYIGNFCQFSGFRLKNESISSNDILLISYTRSESPSPIVPYLNNSTVAPTPPVKQSSPKTSSNISAARFPVQ